MQELQQKLITGGILLFIVVGIGTSGYYGLGFLAQNHPVWTVMDCFYMTVITLTTVGFGEVIDLASVPGARMFTVFILISGLGVSAYFLSTLTAFLVEGELKNVFWRNRMNKKISKMQDHIVLCGAGRVGLHVLGELLDTGLPFVLVEGDEQKIMTAQETHGNFPAICGDSTYDRFLREAGVERASGVISTLGDDKDNLCVVVTCKQLNPNLRVVTRCSNKEFSDKLALVGAEVVIPNFIGGLRMASQMIRPRVVRYLDTMLRDKAHVVRIEELIIPSTCELVGKTVGAIDLKQFGNILLLAVLEKNSQHPHYNPPQSLVIKEGDTFIFQAEREAVDRFRDKYGKDIRHA